MIYPQVGTIDVAVVLGSGLSTVLAEHGDFERISFADIGIQSAQLAGHVSEAYCGDWNGKRVLTFAGRVHGYQGFTASEITQSIALAARHGAKTVILTNAAGALNRKFHAGDLMVIEDHLNLTGLNPLVGIERENPFVNMTGAYSKRLRKLAHKLDDDLKEGVYAGLLGPSYETPAEARYLRSIGADAVGMSTVLETIAARASGLEVFGISLLTNEVGAPDTTHDEVTTIASAAAPRLGKLVDGLIAQI